MVRKRLEAVGKVVEEGAKKLGAAVTPGVKRGGTKKGGGSRYYRRNKKGQYSGSVSEKQLKRTGQTVAGTGATAAGTVAATAGSSSLFKDDKKQSKPLKRERSAQEKETKSQAAARIKKNMQDYEKQRPSKKTWKDVKSVAAAKRAGLKHYTGADGKKKLAITKEELGQKKGETLTQAYNRVQGKTPRKQSAASASTDASKSEPEKKRSRFTSPASGRSRRPGGRAMGGMMKAKGMAKGGKMMKKGYAMGGAAKKFPDLTGDGKVTQKDILRGRGVPGIKKGGSMTKKGMAKGGPMKKKGYAKGGMTKKGYAKGGPAMKSKGASKGGVRRGKPRGVGVALRGFGKALR